MPLIWIKLIINNIKNKFFFNFKNGFYIRGRDLTGNCLNSDDNFEFNPKKHPVIFIKRKLRIFFSSKGGKL